MKALSSMLKKKKLALTRDLAVLFLVEIGIYFSNNEVRENLNFWLFSLLEHVSFKSCLMSEYGEGNGNPL